MPIELTTATALLDTDPLLRDIQCNVLAAHKCGLSVHLFVALPPGNAANAYARDWAQRVDSMATQVKDEPARQKYLRAWMAAQSSFKERLRRSVHWMLSPRDAPVTIGPRAAHRGVLKSFMLTSAGLGRLGFTGLPVVDDGFDLPAVNFETSLWNDGTSGDTFAQAWASPFNRASVEAQILIAADDTAALFEELDRELDTLLNRGGQLLGLRHGYLRKNRDDLAIEHFGYADGIGNPQFLASGLTHPHYAGLTKTEIRQRHFYPLSQVLFRLNGIDQFGSFQVFRQIEQNVAEFNLTRPQERDCAIGRRPNGTPLADPTATGATGCPGRDAFDYQRDPIGSRCPFHAHIRKANPRDNPPRPDRREIAFPRRGMLYGPRPFDAFARRFTGPDPSAGVGLLFMAYMGSIDRQFRVMQKGWLSSLAFPADPTKPLLPGHGPDQLVTLPEPAQPVTKVLGAAYFFVPPITWLAALP